MRPSDTAPAPRDQGPDEDPRHERGEETGGAHLRRGPVGESADRQGHHRVQRVRPEPEVPQQQRSQVTDERTYDVAAALLNELGIKRIRLLTNNPQKISSLRDHGIEVAGRLPLVTTSNMHNERYLRAKHERAGHLDIAEN